MFRVSTVSWEIIMTTLAKRTLSGGQQFPYPSAGRHSRKSIYCAKNAAHSQEYKQHTSPFHKCFKGWQQPIATHSLTWDNPSKPTHNCPHLRWEDGMGFLKLANTSAHFSTGKGLCWWLRTAPPTPPVETRLRAGACSRRSQINCWVCARSRSAVCTDRDTDINMLVPN